MEDQQQLKPCPFCGEAPSIVTRDVEPQGDPWYGRKDETFVLCDCGACLFDGGFHEGFYDAETRAVAAWNRRASPSSSVLERARDALKGCVDSLAFLRENGVYVWPNHPANPEQIARSALAEIDRALGGGNAE